MLLEFILLYFENQQKVQNYSSDPLLCFIIPSNTMQMILFDSVHSLLLSPCFCPPNSRGQPIATLIRGIFVRLTEIFISMFLTTGEILVGDCTSIFGLCVGVVLVGTRGVGGRCHQGGVSYVEDILSKRILNSNLAKPDLPITYYPVTQSFRHFHRAWQRECHALCKFQTDWAT